MIHCSFLFSSSSEDSSHVDIGIDIMHEVSLKKIVIWGRILLRRGGGDIDVKGFLRGME